MERINSVGEVIKYEVGQTVYLMDTFRNRIQMVTIESIEPNQKTLANSTPRVSYEMRDRTGAGFSRYVEQVHPTAQSAAAHGERVLLNTVGKHDVKRCALKIRRLKARVLNMDKGASALAKLRLHRKRK